MTVCFPKGFVAGSAAAGLKSNSKLDVTVVRNLGPDKFAAAVFTSNRAKAHPVIWSQEAIKDGIIDAVLLNSGGANCFTGPAGFVTTHRSAEAVAEKLSISAGDVLVCSTGMIGELLDEPKLLAGIGSAIDQLSDTGGEDSARAIMTTDSVPKLATRQSNSGWKIGAMAKGAGMLAPALATMLVVITTDAKLTNEAMNSSLRLATKLTFDRLDSDGCTSTNDTVVLLSSGASEISPIQAEFDSLLLEVCHELAQKLMQDAEGAEHEITIEVCGAASESDAVEVARAVARNNLFKAAIYGKDPNWGRILAAVGTTAAEFDPYDLDVFINNIRVSSKGGPDRDRSEVDLSSRTVQIKIDLKSGAYSATVLTNDLTKAYVIENSEYSS